MSFAHVQNRGTGAGGANTNVSGLSFENRTANEMRLVEGGWERHIIPGAACTKYGYYLKRADVVYVTKSGLAKYMKHFYGKEICREPDEAYIVKRGPRIIVKVLEKKNQTTEGSVDTKLLAGPGFIEEYKFCLGETFDVEYGFCVSDFLKKKYESEDLKWRALRSINARHRISVLYGDDADYFSRLDAWLSS